MSLSLASKMLFTILPFEDSAAVLRHDRKARYRFLEMVTEDMRIMGESSMLLCGSCAKIYWFKEVEDGWIEVRCVHWTMRRKGLAAGVRRWWQQNAQESAVSN